MSLKLEVELSQNKSRRSLTDITADQRKPCKSIKSLNLRHCWYERDGERLAVTGLTSCLWKYCDTSRDCQGTSGHVRACQGMSGYKAKLSSANRITLSNIYGWNVKLRGGNWFICLPKQPWNDLHVGLETAWNSLLFTLKNSIWLNRMIRYI